MSTLAVPYNIQSYAGALAEGLAHGDKIHLGVCGNHVTEDAVFLRFHEEYKGIVVAMGSVNGNRPEPLLWGDIVELWLLEEKPNTYYSDVPEVADMLKKMKANVKTLVEANDASGICFLMEEIFKIKKAEPLFDNARRALLDFKF